MTVLDSSIRPFEPGTTGWTVDDLDDPQIERQWEMGAYEIVEGVLTKMPPAYYDGNICVGRLVRIVERHLDAAQIPGEFTFESDLVLGSQRLARPDAVFLTPEQHRQQKELNARRSTGRKLTYGRLLIPPTLIIESISPGHERHDRDIKRDWYAQARVPNYWLLDGYSKSLECLILDGPTYRTDQAGQSKDELHPSLFPGLSIALAKLWE